MPQYLNGRYGPYKPSVILGLVVGFLLVTRPEAGLLAVALLLVIYFMIDGLARVVFALTIRPMDDWEWLLASGVAGVVLAMVVAAQLGTVADFRADPPPTKLRARPTKRA